MAAARALCARIAVHIAHAEAGGEIFILGGEYADELVRTPDGWRIAARTLSSWWTTTSHPAQT